MKKDLILVATHIIPLVKAFDESEGDVLELGTGYFSTTLLDWLCHMTGRKLISYDTIESWGNRAKKRYENEYHKVSVVRSLDMVNLTDRHWGLVLIDHSPKGKRYVDAIRLRDNADYIVLHDTDLSTERLYHYSKVYPYFKYIYQYTKIEPHTAVISNFKDVTKWK